MLASKVDIFELVRVGMYIKLVIYVLFYRVVGAVQFFFEIEEFPRMGKGGLYRASWA